MCPPTSGGSDTGEPDGTSAPTGDLHTATGEPTTTDAASSSSTDTPGASASSSGAPVDATPLLGQVLFAPQPLQEPGSITVTVEATHATHVTMRLADGTVSALEPAGENLFTGHIDVTWGLPAGERLAYFTPKGTLEGVEEPRPYLVEIPVGTEAWWDASPDLGTGEIRSLRAGAGHLWEFGSHQVGLIQECYLRRRDLVGKYGPDDVTPVLPGKSCLAQDLALGPLGQLYLLMQVTTQGTQRWLVGEMITFGNFSKVDEGAAGERASALAIAPDGGVVACGHGPSPFGDLDARIWFRDADFGWTKSFDYIQPPPAPGEPHRFDERIADCAVAPSGRLVLVGSAFGRHEKDPKMPKRERLALLGADLDDDAPQWTVVDTTFDLLTQSAAHSVALDDAGRSIVSLSLFKDMKQPGVVGQVRVFGPSGEQEGLPPPLNLPGAIVPPLDVAWIPAGYFVLASARPDPKDPNFSEFFVQAYHLGEGTPLWTYTQTEGLGVHLARTLTFVPGVVVAGGIGGAGFPTLAFIYG